MRVSTGYYDIVKGQLKDWYGLRGLFRRPIGTDNLRITTLYYRPLRLSYGVDAVLLWLTTGCYIFPNRLFRLVTADTSNKT